MRFKFSFQSTRPRGARHVARLQRAIFQRFNPRARGGRDLHCRGPTGRIWRFQSTRPRGARPAGGATWAHSRKFQSTRPRGARLQLNHQPKPHRVSIHAPAGGATPHCHRDVAAQLFQSTRPRGARHPTATGTWQLNCFNPRARGGRDSSKRISIIKSGFQSTRPRGARRPPTNYSAS